MWTLAAVAAGLVVVAGIGIGLFALGRILPPGATKEVVSFVPNCVVLLRRLRADHRLPAKSRLALSAALAYLLSPVQLIPNLIPVLGQTDDLIAVALALRYTCRRLPRGQVEAAWSGDPAYLQRLLGPPPQNPSASPASDHASAPPPGGPQASSKNQQRPGVSG